MQRFKRIITNYILHIVFSKKFLNYIGQSIDQDGEFLTDMRRSKTKAELFTVFEKYLIQGEKSQIEVLPEPLFKHGTAKNSISQGCNPVDCK